MALFDNIKGILIILVVLGHIAHPIHNENPVLSAVFDTIYLFHMPLFVFMSGLLRKGRVPRRQAQRRPHFEFSRSRLWLPDSARARQRRSAHARAHPLVHVSAVVSGLHGMLVRTDPGALASGPSTRPGARARCIVAVGHGRPFEWLARHQPNNRVFAVLRARVLPKTAGHPAHSQLARGIVRSCDRSRDCRHTRDRPRRARVVLSHGLMATTPMSMAF